MNKKATLATVSSKKSWRRVWISTTPSKICKCFGGPLNGQSIALEDAQEAKYVQFIMGTTVSRGNKNYHNTILVYLPEVTI